MGYGEGFYEGLRSVERGGDQDGCGDGSWMPSKEDGPVYVSGAGGRVVFSPKWGVLNGSVLGRAGAPEGTMVFYRNAVLSIEQVRPIRQVIAQEGEPVWFIGDLSPRHLAIYLSLRVGGIGGPKSDEPPVDVRYVGIDDAWLAECQAHTRPTHSTPRNPTPEAGGQRPEAVGDWCGIVRRTGHNWAWAEMEATPTAMKGLAWLESTGLDWDSIVGPTCMAMLRSGWTLELEGATNPHIYTEDFTRRLSKRLFG